MNIENTAKGGVRSTARQYLRRGRMIRQRKAAQIEHAKVTIVK